ncbi:MAG: H-NS histone family protein [Pseudomonadota bacterium]|nr:H-NS histone family protein [Pseudomonadota bacterium]
MEYENLSVDEIQQQLENLDKNRADLEKALEQRHQQAKYDLVQHIKDLIQENGYEISEIAVLLGGRKRRTPAAKPSTRQYVRYVDPEDSNNVYVRGVLPGWMKQKMLDQGYDPTSKEDREAFKANYLHVLED